ncbi:xylanase [Lutibacter sp. A80]|uniref:glycoside hydrolase n=1 Tax=Lutibacter sp. A80 TaxID=2918453 RepID=UPI001F069662|nr:glycoside hydrolase [Lutibacter sp. A80]UMB62049.1 xylanase [Lutibacter sp. A80]
MKTKLKYIIIGLIFQFSFGQQKDSLKVIITPEVEYQTIHNFGASDAWTTQFVGNWPLEKKDAIADLLFGLEYDSTGSPKGIGLSAWRFNIGAGSAEQGALSGIKDSWRRAEGFLQDDLSYNWKSQSGQQWFLLAAKQRGVKDFVGFVNSPPVQLTKNNKAYPSNANSSNLAEENYNSYAVFLAEVVKNFKRNLNIELTYISPFNEPQWEWIKGSQEGSPWNNNELALATKAIDKVFNEENLKTKLEISEAGSIGYLTSEKTKFNNRSNQVEEFFNTESSNYIGDLNSVVSKFAGHSYFTTWKISKLKKEREKIAQKLGEYPNLEYWMTEYCVLENNEEIKGKGKDLGMNTALYVSRVIHSDLTISNASAWHWWIALSAYNYKDGLIYVDKATDDGEFVDSKLLWALGNYARFIRPEAKRIKVDYKDINSIENLKNGLLVSAYKNSDNSIVVVVVNQQKNAVHLDMLIDGTSAFKAKKMYTTNKSLNLKNVEIKNNKPLIILGASINTIIYEE